MQQIVTDETKLFSAVN